MKRFLSLMLCMMCIVCIKAQDTPPSGWKAPTGNYEKETVVYAIVKDGAEGYNENFPAVYERKNSEIAAFIDGEVRALVKAESCQKVESPAATYYIYTFRVGGDLDNDLGKEITFQIYDATQGLTYPLTCKTQDGTSATLTWTGDATAEYPSNYYELSFTSVVEVGLIYNVDMIQLNVGETKNISDFIEVHYHGIGDEPPTTPTVQGAWSWIPSEDIPGELTVNGDEITAVSEGRGELFYRLGNAENSVWVEIMTPMTSVAIGDITVYKGYKEPTFLDVIYNDGESMPTNYWLEYIFDETKLEIAGEDNFGNPSFIAGPEAEIGDVVEVTARSMPNNDTDDIISTTFNVTIASVLDTYTAIKENVSVWLDYGEMDLSNRVPSPSYTIIPALNNDAFYDYFDSENNNLDAASVVSDNPGVVEFNSDHILVAKSKGVAHVTFTNVYDPSKTATVTVNVNQYPVEIAITQVNGVEIPASSPVEPSVEVAIGQMTEAMSLLTPEDADYSDYTINFVNANGELLEDMSWLSEESNVSVADDGLCIFNFKANEMPSTEVYLQAVVALYPDDTNGLAKEYLLGSQKVKVVFVKKVAEIKVPESKTVWVNQLPSKEIMVDIVPEIYPEDATNKELEITFDKEGILEEMTSGNLLPHEKGTVKVTYTSVDNPSVTATCEVTIKVRVQGIEYAIETDKLELYNDGNWTELPGLEIYPEYADFEPEFLDHKAVADDENFPAGWDAVNIDGTRICGRALCDNVSIAVIYNATAQEGLEDGFNPTFTFPATVKEKIDLTEGWNWISLISGEADVRYALNDEAGYSAITEARSQTALIYNDPVFGFFGDLTVLAPRREAYKIDVVRDASMIIEWVNIHSMIYDNKAFDQNINPRWNWVGYPYEYKYLLSQAYDATQLAEGDMVITKTGDMAIIKDGEWTGDFFVKPNTGMMLYHNGDVNMALPMKARGDLYQGYWEGDAIPRAKGRDISVWQYDGSRFPNMMAVVGQLNIDSADDYTIGAFVGDECRGAGKIIDGLVLVSLAGKAGEQVTFRLHNEWTGEFIEVDNVLNFSDMAGSLKNPVMLNVPEDATAIDNVSTEGISINGNVLNFGTYKGTATVTSIDGKVVAKTTESSISVDELPAGIYVVVIEGGAKPIVKKIVKE